jgi:phage shock protein A
MDKNHEKYVAELEAQLRMAHDLEARLQALVTSVNADKSKLIAEKKRLTGALAVTKQIRDGLDKQNETLRARVNELETKLANSRMLIIE